MTKAYVGYARVSTDKQGRSGLGLEAQEAAIQSYVDRQLGALVLPLFVEVESGRKTNRAELNKALDRAKLLGATLVVAKLDRLSRDASFLMELVKAGVEVVFCDMPELPEGAMGSFMLRLMASIAELEVGLISQRTKAALKAAKARGKALGGYRGGPKVDYRLGLKARQERSQAFRERVIAVISDLDPSGMQSATSLAKQLTELGVKTSRGGSKWTAGQVLRLVEHR
ncbi:recombinase family protein [Parvibaculum sp.]|uniref:recombinase family protein n=1 Tax=Parvibaculum sp. TaxID=2024848 RepID=UPI0032108D72